MNYYDFKKEKLFNSILWLSLKIEIKIPNPIEASATAMHIISSANI
jgi:hypothetical protein